MPVFQRNNPFVILWVNLFSSFPIMISIPPNYLMAVLIKLSLWTIPL